ncbi:FAS1-like dehydratase domain-containing protein [Rhodococcus koreensis]
MTNPSKFEELVVGSALPSTIYNLTLQRLVLHASGNRDFTPIHFDDSAAQRSGARGSFINNVFCVGMWERTIRDFVGPAGVIHSIRGMKMSSFNVVGDCLVTEGWVERTWVTDGVGFAEIGMRTKNLTVDRVTVGPGTVVVSLPADGRTGATEMSKRFSVDHSRDQGAPQVTKIDPAQLSSSSWAAVAAMQDENLLVVPEVRGADRVEASVIRRLCEPLELGSPVYDDPDAARSWGYATAVAPVCGAGTTYVDPGSWHPGEPTQYPVAARSAPPARPLGVETGSNTRKLPVPHNSVGILTEVSLDLHDHIYLGDRLSVRSVRLVAVAPKRTSVGDGAFLTFINEIWNERNHVATVKKVQFQYQPIEESESSALRT